MNPVSEGVAGAEICESAVSEKRMELSPVEVSELSGRLASWGERLNQDTTVTRDAKNKESVTDFDEKLLDIDKALSVEYLDSNLNSCKHVAVSDEIGIELGAAKSKEGYVPWR